MFFWVINLSAITLYGVLTKKFRKDKIFLIIACIHIGIITGFRSINVGTDTYNYAHAFNVIKNGGHLSENHVVSASKIFFLLLKIFSFLPRTQGYMLITSVPVIFLFYFLIKKYSGNYYLSVLTFFTSYLFFYSMNAARHFMAIALIFLCFLLLENREIVYSILIFLIACLLHNAVSIFVLYYLIYMIKWNSKRFIAFTIGLMVMMKAMPLFIIVFVKIFPYYAWLSSKVFDRYYISGGRTSLVYAFYSFFAALLNFLVVLKKENILSIKIGTKDIANTNCIGFQNIQFMYRISCMMIIAMVMLGMCSNSILISRMSYVFFAFIILALPNALINIRYFRFWVAITYIPLVAFMFLQLQGNYSGVLNYSFGF